MSGEVPFEGVKDWTGASSQWAVTVRGNEVSQPLGKALWVRRGFGAIVVTGNSLESYGDPVYGAWLPAAHFCWDSGNGSVSRAAGGACVEIINYARALDYAWSSEVVEELSWTDAAGGVVDGGDVLVSGNSMRLSWDWVGGIGASVVISSLSSAVFDSNVSVIEMGSTYVPAPMADFYADMVTDADVYAVAMFNVYVGAMSAAQVVGCRMVEGKYDCLYSAVLGPALSPVENWTLYNDHASVLVSNVGTHRMFGGSAGTQVPQGSGSPLEDELNAAVYKNEASGLALWANYAVSGGTSDVRKVSVEYLM